MTTFEERFTAWVDGRLSGRELQAFERELEEHPDALIEKQATLKLGDLLREHVKAPPLTNADFFNIELLRQIETVQPEGASASRPRRGFWTLPRMALSGAFLLVLSTLLYFAAVPQTNRDVQRHERYVSNILNASSDDPNITATSFHSARDDVNVVWLDGVGTIPPDHKLK